MRPYLIVQIIPYVLWNDAVQEHRSCVDVIAFFWHLAKKLSNSQHVRVNDKERTFQRESKYAHR